MIDSMSPERFDVLAESFGADIARWPPAEREAARALLEESALAREVIARQRVLDRLLDTLPAPDVPSVALRERILADAPGAPARVARGTWLAALWDELGGSRRAGPVFAASLAIGIALAPIAGPSDPQWMDIAVEDIEWTDEEYEDLVP
jgi:anti-sigma-K factor RskA